jgi:lambda family phage portal protein
MALRDWFGRRAVAPATRAEPRLINPGAAGLSMVPRQAGRAWLAAQPSRLLADLPGGAAAAPNRDIRQQLAVLRARSRWLAQNDGYTAGLLKMLRRNVVGPKGFTLQMRVANERDGKQDDIANRIIEAGWSEWCRVGACDVTGRLSFDDFCRMLIVGIARDGEALVRRHRSARFNRFGFALEALDPSQLDETVNGRPAGDMPAGNVVRMGVELSVYGRAEAYWMKTLVPNDDVTAQGRGTMRTVRIPADEIMHVFMSDWPGQARGVPWIASGIRTLAMLDGYAEAELTAARVAAGKMGFYKIDADQEPDGELTEDGRLMQQAEAGSFELLPKGVSFEGYDPQHPNTAFKDFVGATLRPAAAGVGVSYNAFANDAEGMNYSTLRATELEDREEFRTIQQWMIGAFCLPVFEQWLTESLLSNALGGLPASKYWKFNKPEFVPRGWQWVDPLKEVAAMEKAVALGITSRTQIVAAQGGDIDAVAAYLTVEQQKFAGIVPPAGAAAPPAPAQEDN